MKDSTRITLNRFSNNFVTVRHLIIRDARLSLEARGLLILLISFPPGWTFYYKHLIKLMPCTKYKLKKTISELRAIGAISSKANKLTAEEAAEINIKNNKNYKPGYFYGHIWDLIDPEKWAIEYDLYGKPLSNQNISEVMDIERSESRCVPDFDTKKYLHKEIFNKTTTGRDLEERKSKNICSKSNDSCELIFPEMLTIQDREIASNLLAPFEYDMQQKILKQFQWAIFNNRIRIKSNPLLYLKGIIQNAEKDGLVFTAHNFVREQTKPANKSLELETKGKINKFKYDSEKRKQLKKYINQSKCSAAKV